MEIHIQGLSSKEAQKKLIEYGFNKISSSSSVSAFSVFLAQFPSFINAILAIAAIFSFLIKETTDGIVILLVLILNSLFSFLQEYRAEKSLEKLKNITTAFSRVVRDGEEKQIKTEEIVPGDVVILSEGDHIPSDGKLLVNHRIEIDESILTGESLPVRKEKDEVIFAGTLLIKGRGTFIVEKTGKNSRFGQIAETLSSIKSTKTPLQIELSKLGKTISFFILIICLIMFPIGWARYKDLVSILLITISIGIAAIPEGLPAVITIALAIGTNRLAKKKAIVRTMASIETLGAVQVLLVDKTGTLTENKMKVKKYMPAFKNSLTEMMSASVFSNTATLIQKEDGGFDVLGDRTDAALLLWINALGNDIQKIKREGILIDEYVFDPQNKTITAVVEKDHKHVVYVRGAPEVILEKSTMTQKEREAFINSYKEYAKEGLRVIAFGKKHEVHAKERDRDQLERDLQFLGLVGIHDAPRPEVRLAIQKALNAGIRVIMVTGDNELTAMEIAKEVGLSQKNEDVLTGEELKNLSDEKLQNVLLKTNVFARTGPEDKLRLTNFFRSLGFVVGVTGDGVNDALALKKADVGIAMGEEGTDVAKEASDIILTDDNFATLVNAIEEGRVIYKNIVNAVIYLLTGNLSELGLIFFAAILGIPAPLLPTQILWINLVTDSLPALALASDSKSTSLIHEKPRNHKLPLINSRSLIFISSVGLTVSISLLVSFVLLQNFLSLTFSRTVVFNLMVVLQMLVVFIIRGRSLKSLNKFFLGSVLITLLAQIAISTIPFFQSIFQLGF